MHQCITHIYNVTPGNFRMFFSEIFGQEIGSLTNNHNIINNGMITHSVRCHIFERLPVKIVINMLYTFVNMAKAIYISNCFSHKLLSNHDLLLIGLRDEGFLLL